MTTIQKCRIIAEVVKKHGTPLTLPDSYGYYGVEVVRTKGRHHIILPFVLNVSFGVRSVKFYGDGGDAEKFQSVLDILFNQLSRLADV